MANDSRAGGGAAIRTAATGIAVAVAVAGSAFSGQWLLSGDGPPAAPIAAAPAAAPVPVSQAPSTVPTTSSPTPSSSASPAPSPRRPAPTRPAAAPAPTSASPTARSIPASVPSRVFLAPAERNDRSPATDSTGRMLPVLCRSDLADGYRVGVRRTKSALFRNEATPPDSVVDGSLQHTVTVHRGDGAEEFMSALRAAVNACPEDTVEGTRYRYRLADGGRVGDDSILMERQYEQPESVESTTLVWRTALVSAVRVGDAVTVVDATGWEGTDVTAERMVDLTDAAYRRLDDWR
jgi:hypothetical protein